MGRSAREGNSPVNETLFPQSRILSTAEHVKLRRNPGGPSPKAKYSLVTDSNQYREGKVKSTPEGE